MYKTKKTDSVPTYTKENVGGFPPPLPHCGITRIASTINRASEISETDQKPQHPCAQTWFNAPLLSLTMGAQSTKAQYQPPGRSPHSRDRGKEHCRITESKRFPLIIYVDQFTDHTTCWRRNFYHLKKKSWENNHTQNYPDPEPLGSTSRKNAICSHRFKQGWNLRIGKVRGIWGECRQVGLV